MPNVLVIYASTHGHTGKIAARIGAALERDGVTVTLHDVRACGAHRGSPAATLSGNPQHARPHGQDRRADRRGARAGRRRRPRDVADRRRLLWPRRRPGSALL